MFLLDANVVSEIRKIAVGRAKPSLERGARGLDGAAAFVSAVTVHELKHGVLLVERRDPDGAGPLRQWPDVAVRDAFADRILGSGRAGDFPASGGGQSTRAVEELARGAYRGGRLQRELAGLHSARRGAYRIIYEIHDKERLVVVLRVDHRSHLHRSR